MKNRRLTIRSEVYLMKIKLTKIQFITFDSLLLFILQEHKLSHKNRGKLSHTIKRLTCKLFMLSRVNASR